MHAEDFDRRVASLGSFDYPAMARITMSQGQVDLLIDIDEKGTVVDAVVVKSASPLLREAARQSILSWRFQPSDQPTRGVPFIYIFKLVDLCPKSPCAPDFAFEAPNKVTISVKPSGRISGIE
jgi:TonB family protein